MEVNFECKKCKGIFDCDVGNISMNEETFRPIFENKLICPKCGELTMDEVFLTELGQGQLTDITMNL